MRWALGCVAVFLIPDPFAWAQSPTASLLDARIGIDDRLDSVGMPASLRARDAGLPVFVRLVTGWTTLPASSEQLRALDERLDEYSRMSIPVVLSIPHGPTATEQPAAWAEGLRSLARLGRGRTVGFQVEAPPGQPLPAPQAYAFLVKLAAVQLRAIDPRLFIVQATIRSSDVSWQRALYAEDVAAYVDVVATSLVDEPLADPAAGLDALTSLVAAQDPTAEVVAVGVPVSPGEAASPWLVSLFLRAGPNGVRVTTLSGSPQAISAALTAANRVKDLLARDVVPLADRDVSLILTAAGADLTIRVPHRVFLNAARGSIHLAYWGARSGQSSMDVSILDPLRRTPVVRDAVGDRTTPVRQYSWDQTTQVARLTADLSPGLLLLDLTPPRPTQLISRAEVTSAASLDVEEVIFRYQQAHAAQDQSFRTFIASLRLELHFRPTPTQVFDVVSENRFFFSRDVVEWVELSFAVNGTRWGPNRPGLPLLQAEKVLTLPLDLRLTSDYRYRLEGIDTVNGRRCYVVAFDPRDSQHSRYRGRVWIDAEHFLRVKMQTLQTQLAGNIVSNEETAWYGPVASANGRSVHLPVRLSAKQILLVAGRNLLLEKEQWFSDFQVDSADFEDQRRAARVSDRVMFRDTDEGVRYLVKRDDDRVVSTDLQTSSKALALGTLIDPALDFPLPIVGINYLDFDFGDFAGGQSQLALLFGGVFGLGTIQIPRLGGAPLDASVDFFGIAVPSTDLRFDSVGERQDERLLTIPASSNANLGYQLTPFQKITGGYQVRFDAYFAAPETSTDFVQPVNTWTHGAHVRYEYSRRGYQLRAGTSVHHRLTWRDWGGVGDFRPTDQTYRRYSIGLAKDFLLGPFQTVHAGATWHGGARLDRFSMYQFGLFDEVRMHGVPTAGVRFPELVLLRGSYSFNVFRLYRLDLFLDQAFGRDPVERSTWRRITGTGVSVTLKSPWNTMFSADVGKSFLPDIYRHAGSVVVQLMLLKPF
jgi:hypothetical protein